MLPVYSGRSSADAHLFAALLGARGIAHEVRGEPLWATREPSLSRKPRSTTVWVRESDAAAAEQLVAEHRSRTDGAAGQEEWTCACGESSPSAFDVCWSCGAPRDGVEPDDVLPGLAQSEAAAVAGAAMAVADPSDRNRGDDFPWATLLVTVACTIVWRALAIEALPESDAALSRWGWRPASDVWDGAWWSLLVGCFVHGDGEHLFWNMAWLWVFGIPLERAFGRWRWLAFLLAAGFVSAAIDQGWQGIHSFGASGITNAAFGLFVVTGLVVRFLPMWFFVPLCVYFFVTGTVIDAGDLFDEALGHFIENPVANVAHLSGLAFGLLTGLAFVARWRPLVCGFGYAAMGVSAIVPLFWMPWGVDWLLDRAEREERGGNIPRALGYLDRAERLRPSDAVVLATRAEVLLRVPDFAKALVEADRAVEVDAESSVARRARGLARWQAGRHDDARSDLREATSLDPDDAYGWLLLAQVELEQSRLEDAAAAALEATRIAPESASAWTIRGAALRRMGEPFAAREALSEAIALLLAGDEVPADLALRIELGRAYAESGNDAAALECYAAALDERSHERDWRARIERGKLRVRSGNFWGARQDALQATAVNPHAAEGWLVNGLAELGLGRKEPAARAIERAIKSNPQLAAAWVAKAAVCRADGRHEDAIDACDAALALAPRLAEAFRERTEALRAAGRTAEADADRKIADLLSQPVRDAAAE